MASRRVALRSGSAVEEIHRMGWPTEGRLDAALIARSACCDARGAIVVGRRVRTMIEDGLVCKKNRIFLDTASAW